MIPRYQRVLFWVLSISIVLMALFLLHGCEQAREKLTRHRNQTPLAAPAATPDENLRLAIADDKTGAVTLVDRELSLPEDPTARVRMLLADLIAEYSYKNSTHPLNSGPAIDDVFLLDLPLHPAAASMDALPRQSDPGPTSKGGQLAIIDLNETFADQHPSGIEPETLTIQSILGTLYANFPRIQEVRFLVNGRPRETLAGHADLTRVYQVVNSANPAVPSSQEESR